MPFKPGQSGNPAGRPGVPKQIREALAKSLPDRITRLIALADCSDLKVSLEASKYLVDRSLGKPSQAVEMSGPEGKPVRTEIVVRYVGHDD